MQRRSKEKYANSNKYHQIHLEEGFVIDSGTIGSEARFVNHSCVPNAEMQIWRVKSKLHVGIFAAESIPTGAEITYDYDTFMCERQQTCFCGTKLCRGFFGGSRRKSNALSESKRRQSSLPQVNHLNATHLGTEQVASATVAIANESEIAKSTVPETRKELGALSNGQLKSTAATKSYSKQNPAKKKLKPTKPAIGKRKQANPRNNKGTKNKRLSFPVVLKLPNRAKSSTAPAVSLPECRNTLQENEVTPKAQKENCEALPPSPSVKHESSVNSVKFTKVARPFEKDLPIDLGQTKTKRRKLVRRKSPTESDAPLFKTHPLVPSPSNSAPSDLAKDSFIYYPSPYTTQKYDHASPSPETFSRFSSPLTNSSRASGTSGPERESCSEMSNLPKTAAVVDLPVRSPHDTECMNDQPDAHRLPISRKCPDIYMASSPPHQIDGGNYVAPLIPRMSAAPTLPLPLIENNVRSITFPPSPTTSQERLPPFSSLTTPSSPPSYSYSISGPLNIKSAQILSQTSYESPHESGPSFFPKFMPQSRELPPINMNELAPTYTHLAPIQNQSLLSGPDHQSHSSKETQHADIHPSSSAVVPQWYSQHSPSPIAGTQSMFGNDHQLHKPSEGSFSFRGDLSASSADPTEKRFHLNTPSDNTTRLPSILSSPSPDSSRRNSYSSNYHAPHYTSSIPFPSNSMSLQSGAMSSSPPSGSGVNVYKGQQQIPNNQSSSSSYGGNLPAPTTPLGNYMSTSSSLFSEPLRYKPTTNGTNLPVDLPALNFPSILLPSPSSLIERHVTATPPAVGAHVDKVMDRN